MRFALIGILCAMPAIAGHVNWVDWTSATADGPSGTVTGVLHLGSTDVTVTYTGEIKFAQIGGGTDYWITNGCCVGSPPYTSSFVDNAPDWDGSTDIIALYLTGRRTLTFSQPVDNLFFAVVSLNGNGYVFDRDFDVRSSGCGYWGCGGLTKSTPGPGQFELDGVSDEPHGTLQFNGAYSTFTWTSAADEDWNGFTVGTLGLAPEPSSWCMALIGAGLLPLLRRLRR